MEKRTAEIEFLKKTTEMSNQSLYNQQLNYIYSFKQLKILKYIQIH